MKWNLLIFLTLLFSFKAFCLEYGCKYKPSQLAQLADRTVRHYYDQYQNADTEKQQLESVLPRVLPIFTSMEYEDELDSEQSATHFQYEAFLRPKHKEDFQLLNLILFEVDRERSLIYVCINYDSKNRSQNHITVYFLEGFGMDPNLNFLERENLATIPGDLFKGPHGILDYLPGSNLVTRVTDIPIQLTSLHFITEGVSDLLNGLPILSNILSIPASILSFSNMLIEGVNSQLKLGVERIEVTDKNIYFARSVNLAQPQEADILYELNLKENNIEIFK